MAPSQHPFEVWSLSKDGSKKGYVGGSYDNLSAVTIACAFYAALEGITEQDYYRVAVFDSTGTGIAVIGFDPSPPLETAPVDVQPTLTQLNPDSSGNWDAQIQLLGSGFSAKSTVWANGVQVTPVNFVNDTELTVVVHATAQGAYAITVRNGTAESAPPLTFTAL